MIENKCSNCKQQPVCKYKGPYEADRKNLLAMPAALPPLHCETTAIIVICKHFAPTLDAQMKAAEEGIIAAQKALKNLTAATHAAAIVAENKKKDGNNDE